MEIKTEDNLQEAFAGECKANQRYLLFAEKADKEGFPQAARLFRAAAEAEMIHARNHFNAMGGVGSTKDNLTAASLGEYQEFTGMYPVFIDDAERERNAMGLRTFQYADAVEKIHYKHFEEVLAAIRDNNQLEEKQYFVCQICGNTVADEAPEKCPVCGAPRDRFRAVD